MIFRTPRGRLGWGAVACSLAAALLLVSCRNDLSGPGAVRTARFSVVPVFESAARGVVDVDRAYVAAWPEDNPTAVTDTVVQIAPGSDSVQITIVVPLTSPDVLYRLTIALIAPSGDTVFRGGPVAVEPFTGRSATIDSMPISYVGVGFDAASVEIVTMGARGFFGQAVTVDAVAKDGQGNPIPGTPILWSSLNPQLATVPDPGQGTVVAGMQRGSAQIVATLLTGPADTGSVMIQPPPSAVIGEGGDQQTGPVGGTLTMPLQIQVTGSDGLGVEDVSVDFTTPDGGSFTSSSVVTDATGRGQTQWVLGTVAGGQTAAASVSGAAQVQFVFNATATALAATGLDFGIQPSDAFVGAAIAPPTSTLTGGVILVAGDFTQLNTTSDEAFQSQGTAVELNGAALQTVTFTGPVATTPPFTGSFFQQLDITNTAGGVLFADWGNVAGDLTVSNAVPLTVNGSVFEIQGDLATPGDLTVGASLAAFGGLSVGGTYSVGISNFLGGPGQVIPTGLAYSEMIVENFLGNGLATFGPGTPVLTTLTLDGSGTFPLAGLTTVGGFVLVEAGAELDLAGPTLDVTGDFAVETDALLTMADPADLLIVGGHAISTVRAP